MFLLVPAHPGFPGQIPQSRKTVVVFVLCIQTDSPMAELDLGQSLISMSYLYFQFNSISISICNVQIGQNLRLVLHNCSERTKHILFLRKNTRIYVFYYPNGIF